MNEVISVQSLEAYFPVKLLFDFNMTGRCDRDLWMKHTCHKVLDQF